MQQFRWKTARKALALAAMVFLLWGEPHAADAEDEIDLMLQHGGVPTEKTIAHGYSDFTDPLGRFIDLLAAGAFAEARSIQPDACAAWVTTRQTSPLTGRFWVWNTELNLDTLCPHH